MKPSAGEKSWFLVFAIFLLLDLLFIQQHLVAFRVLSKPLLLFILFR